MTQKELLYLMDIVNHLKHFTENVNLIKNNISIGESKQFLNTILEDSKTSYDEYTSMVCSGGLC